MGCKQLLWKVFCAMLLQLLHEVWVKLTEKDQNVETLGCTIINDVKTKHNVQVHWDK